MSRHADVYFKGRLAGRLSELYARGYQFVYDPEFLADGVAISLTLPLRCEPYESEMLFPFFAGLIPEGWYLQIVSKTLKIDEQDTFGLLMHTCEDCIGAVSLKDADHGQV
ncbi:MAG: phosphatidylinositol kinase [Phycisphaeraceae bacterium]|nr:phosphatidylinositol kinase [Phycisphaeraceae bacterium]|tara:strand:- start:179 stop:508 length:330 start_codon:yes stop_codon:yes gene_type:complete